MPDTVAVQITGHKTRSTSDRYNITSEDDKAGTPGRLAAATGKEKGRWAGQVLEFVQPRWRNWQTRGT